MKITAKIKTTTTSGRPTGLLVCRTVEGLLTAAMAILVQTYGPIRANKIIEDTFSKGVGEWWQSRPKS